MSVQVSDQTEHKAADRVVDCLDAMMALACAAGVITRTHTRMPTERERLNLGDAVCRVLRLGRLRGLDQAPFPRLAEAEEILRTALRLAEQANVPRTTIIAIFNNEDGRPEVTGRRDLQ